MSESYTSSSLLDKARQKTALRFAAGLGAIGLALGGCSNETKDEITNTTSSTVAFPEASTGPAINSDATNESGISNDITETKKTNELSLDDINLDGPLFVVDPNIDKEKYEQWANWNVENADDGYKYLAGLHQAYKDGNLSYLNELGFTKNDVRGMYYIAAIHQDLSRDLVKDSENTPLMETNGIGYDLKTLTEDMEFVVYVVPKLDDSGVLDDLPSNTGPYQGDDIGDDSSTFLNVKSATGIRKLLEMKTAKYYEELIEKQDDRIAELNSQGTDDIKTRDQEIKIREFYKLLYTTAAAIHKML